MELNKSSEMIFSDQRSIKFEGRDSKFRIVSLVLLAVGVIFLVVGIVLTVIALKEKDEKTHDSNIAKRETPLSGGCDGSEEAKRIGLDEFLSRVQATYYELHPYDVFQDPDVKTETVKERKGKGNYAYQFVKDDGQAEIFLLFKRVLKGASHVIEFSTFKVNVRKKSNANA